MVTTEVVERDLIDVLDRVQRWQEAYANAGS